MNRLILKQILVCILIIIFKVDVLLVHLISDLGDVTGCENGAYDSKFVKTVSGGDELKDFIRVCFV